jgi:hypothetical protein
MHRVRHYCRSCEAFFVLCACQLQDEHLEHRVYLWNPVHGVMAIPDTDLFDK